MWKHVNWPTHCEALNLQSNNDSRTYQSEACTAAGHDREVVSRKKDP